MWLERHPAPGPRLQQPTASLLRGEGKKGREMERQEKHWAAEQLLLDLSTNHLV
jgi:hypothetical protein